MSPPEVWGPAIWTLFHTLAERITEEAYPHVSPQLFKMIVRICKFLPCPECSMDATNFLAKIKMSELKTKLDFKNAFYLFHNYVNAKKRKQLFNYSNMYVYSKYRIIDVVNNFIAKYHTKGNMKLLTESFQRQFIINDFKKWFTASMKAFVPRVNIPPQIQDSTIETKSEEVSETKLSEMIAETVSEATVSEATVSEATVSEATVSEATVSVQSEDTVSSEESKTDTVEEKINLNENIVNEEIISQETTDISEEKDTVATEEMGRLIFNE
jgi:hypothetical protein